MDNIEPINYLTRCFNYRALISEGAQFQEHNKNALVSDYGLPKDQEVSHAHNLGLADISPLARTGFKGREAINWLRSQGLEIGDHNNQAYVQNNGILVARLADTEALILNSLHTHADHRMPFDKKYEQARPMRCYSVPRFNSSAWLIITGQNASAMFAKICGVDLRLNKFINGSIAQTSIARINGIIIRSDLRNTPAFHLVFDSASTDYMWSCLKDAFLEFNGAPIGYSALSKL